MPADAQPDPRRLLVVQPSWVGDAVMATPALRALRRRLPGAHVSLLLRRNLRPIYRGLPVADRLLTYRRGASTARLAGRLRAGRFDAAVLLPGSFRSALLVRAAGVPRRIGYDRDGRGFLLTDKLVPLRDAGRFVPVPAVKSYLALAAHLGATPDHERLELAVTGRDEREGAATLRRAGLGDVGRLAVLNPGASYGSAKCWPPGYFAKVADTLAGRGWAVALSGGPGERAILREILKLCRQPVADLPAAGLTLGGLKAVLRRAGLLLTGDTGPRHMAAALGTPVVTLFGPTDPAWTVIDFDRERQLSVPVFCGPCQRKTCPLDHRCMTRLTPAMAVAACAEVTSSE